MKLQSDCLKRSYSQSERRSQFGSRRTTSVRCQAFFSQLFQRGNAQPSDKLLEKPAYKANEMVDLAPGIRIAPMGLGTWSWGNQFLWGYKEEQDPELQEVFNYVVSKGVNFFDTADSYGTGKLNGKSEQLLGQFIEQYPGSDKTRSNLHVATKVAAYPWRVFPSSIVSAARGSLSRLGGDQISVGQLHWSTAKYAPLQEMALQAGLGDMYEEGVVRAVGVSNYGPKQLKKIHTYLERRGVPLASAQIQYSLLSCGGMQQEAKAVCDDLGIIMIAYSPLALGLLSGKYDKNNLPSGPRGNLFAGLLPEITPLLELLSEIAEQRNKTMSQVALNWCMCQDTVPIPGARTMKQAEEVIGALGWRLNAGEIAELTATATGLKKGMIQNIFQTD